MCACVRVCADTKYAHAKHSAYEIEIDTDGILRFVVVVVVFLFHFFSKPV